MNFIQTKSFQLATYQRGDDSAEKLALVLPGRLDTKDYIHMTSLVDFLADNGYLAVSFDPPGTWDSPGDISLFTNTNYIAATKELIDYFNRPTLLAGHSRGATVSIFCASHQNVIGVVNIMGSLGTASPPEAKAKDVGYEETWRDLPPGSNPTTDKKLFNLPLNYFVDALNFSAAEEIKKVLVPKLFIYGDKDEFTTPARAQEVFDAMPSPKQLHIIDSNHDYRYDAGTVTLVNELIGRFIKTYLEN